MGLAPFGAAGAQDLEPQEPQDRIFRCETSLQLASLKAVAADTKGLAIDDTTFENCTGDILEVWPNTNTKVTSVRLFMPWGVAEPHTFLTDRLVAWKQLKAFAQRNNVMFLLGTSISCSQESDEKEWQLTKQFMKYLGSQHFMGLSMGNELEMLYLNNSRHRLNSDAVECRKRLFEDGVYESEFDRRVAELDKMPGFSNMPLSAVFGMYSTAQNPFLPEVASFLKHVWGKYGHRFAFSFNLYPYFDPTVRCSPGYISAATSFDAKGMVPNMARVIRSRMEAIGAVNAKLWIGETGWSSPKSAMVEDEVADCEAFSSQATLTRFYEGFIQWDTAASRVDHVFYFSMHDSQTYEGQEHFGLVSRCGETLCKLN